MRSLVHPQDVNLKESHMLRLFLILWLVIMVADLLVVGEGYLGRMLLPRLPVNLHGNRVLKHDPDLPGLTHPVGLPQPDLHLADVEAGEDTEHFQLAVTDAWSLREVLVACSQLPRSDTGAPTRNVKHHDRLNLGQLNLLAVHVEDKLLIQVLTLSLQNVLCTVTEVNELVDDA